MVAGQTCLSDAQIAALVAYAKRGGRLVVTGESGRYDEWNRQRFDNPLKKAVGGLPNVVWRDETDEVTVQELTHIKYIVDPPSKGCATLAADLEKAGYRAVPAVVSAPEHVFAEYKREGDVTYVHLLNYDFLGRVEGVMLRIPKGCEAVFSAPLDPESAPTEWQPRPVDGDLWRLPPFVRYALVTIRPQR